MGILKRFPEREGLAENFLTLKKRLPPLNSSCERLLGKYWLAAEAVTATRAIPVIFLRKSGNWVEPRVIKLVPVSGAGFFIFCANNAPHLKRRKSQWQTC
jgi:hypothetical protein